jgi:lauroyl/myristoyl acyltransferase
MRHGISLFQNTKSNVKRVRYFFETALVRAAARMVPLLPRHVIVPLARVMGLVAYLADYRGRGAALANLRAAFGGELSPADRRAIALASYQNFARTFLDLFWGSRLNAENWREHVHMRFEPGGADELARERGAIWITMHFGGFESLNLAWGFRGFPVTVIAQNFKNPALTGIFKRLREHGGSQVVPQESAMLRLMRVVGRGGHVALLTDLTLKPDRAACAIWCFGLRTCVTTLHAVLATRLQRPLIPVVCLPRDDGGCDAHVLAPVRVTADSTVEEVTQRCWDALEPWIKKYPSCWMWMYKHWRYLPGDDTDERYPEYANANKSFARLVAERGPMRAAK